MTERTPDRQLPEAHTELRRVGDAPTAAPVTAPAKRVPVDMLPNTMSDDALDDLFNDMPI